MSRSPLTELECSLTTDQRRVSVDDHKAFRAGLSQAEPDVDADLDEHLQIDPHVSGTNSRRSDKELARMLDLIDNLPVSTNGKAGRA
jgi:hypothetical protein